MDREKLESYISKSEEIKELRDKLEHLGESDSMVDSDTILDYRSGHPVPQAVVGMVWDRVLSKEEIYKKHIVKLEEECREVEQFVESIEDSMTRRIMRMRYLEGKTQKEIGKNVHMDRSTISKKIDDFLSFHANHKKHIYNNN